MAVAAAVALMATLGQAMAAAPPAAGPAGAAPAPPKILQRLAGLNTRTDAGASEAIATLWPALTAPAGEVDPAARGLCSRYLPAALAQLAPAAKVHPDYLLDGTEALAMCRWLQGDDAAAEGAQAELLRLCHHGDCREGLARAQRLAVRWLWPEPLLAEVTRQLANVPAEDAAARESLEVASRALTQARDRRDLIRRAAPLGRPTAGVLVTAVTRGGDAARGGVQVGDLIVSVDAQPIHTRAELLQRLRPQRAVRLLVLRLGKRLELQWVSDGNQAQVVRLPERIVGGDAVPDPPAHPVKRLRGR